MRHLFFIFVHTECDYFLQKKYLLFFNFFFYQNKKQAMLKRTECRLVESCIYDKILFAWKIDLYGNGDIKRLILANVLYLLQRDRVKYLIINRFCYLNYASLLTVDQKYTELDSHCLYWYEHDKRGVCFDLFFGGRSIQVPALFNDWSIIPETHELEDEITEERNNVANRNIFYSVLIAMILMLYLYVSPIFVHWPLPLILLCTLMVIILLYRLQKTKKSLEQRYLLI